MRVSPTCRMFGIHLSARVIDQILDAIAVGGSPTLIWIWNWEWNWNWGD